MACCVLWWLLVQLGLRLRWNLLTYLVDLFGMNWLWMLFRAAYNKSSDQPRGLVVTDSDYWSWGPGFDFRVYHGDFSLKGKIPMVTTVWIVQYNLGLSPLPALHIHISPSTSSGQRNCASWASQSQTSVKKINETYLRRSLSYFWITLFIMTNFLCNFGRTEGVVEYVTWLDAWQHGIRFPTYFWLLHSVWV
jgi:hypothetical protein